MPDDDDLTAEDLEALDPHEAAELLAVLPPDYERALVATATLRPAPVVFAQAPFGVDGQTPYLPPAQLAEDAREALRASPDWISRAAYTLRPATAERSAVDELSDVEAVQLLAVLDEERDDVGAISTARTALGLLDGAREVVDVSVDAAGTAQDFSDTLKKLAALLR